ncbi:MAG: hypothetical protein V8R26_03310 [Clostridia bacterium]|jgi:hypothetical protein|nr:unknown [Clostridium sp. CAG:452]HJJ03509.1 hypothetical protein [Clostridiaceae bacterium]
MKTKDYKRKIDRIAIKMFGVSQSYLNSGFSAKKHQIEYELWVKAKPEQVEAFKDEVESIISDPKAYKVFTVGKCDGGYKISIMVKI